MLGYDMRLKQLVKLIVVLMAPLRLEHGMQNKKNRSPAECFDYYLSLARGDWTKPLQEMVGMLTQSQVLESICLIIQLVGATSLVANSAPVIEQDEFVTLAVRLVCDAVCVRMSSQLWYSRGLPGVFPKLLSDIKSERDEALRFCKSCSEAWSATKDKAKGRGWTKLITRSFMHQTFVQKVLAHLGDCSNDIARDSKVGRMIMAGFRGVGQSKVVEDLFQCERIDSTKRGMNLRMTSTRKWHVAFSSGVLSERHRFQEPDWRRLQLSRADRELSAKMGSKAFYRPAKRKSPVWFKKLVGKGQTTDWPSFRPAAMGFPAIDMVIMQHYSKSGAYEKFTQCWFAEFFAPVQILIKDGLSYLVVGCLATVVLAVVRIESRKVKTRTVFTLPRLASPPELLVVDDPKSVLVVPGSWSSPLKQLFAYSGVAQSGLDGFAPGDGVVYAASKKPVPFLQEAAAQCFWPIGLLSLQRLSSWLKLDCKPNALVEALTLLIKHFLNPKGTDIADILAMRLCQKQFRRREILAGTMPSPIWLPRPFILRLCHITVASFGNT